MKCCHCQKEIADNSVFCPECGTKQTEEQSKTAVKQCLHCHHDMPVGAQHCPNCGAAYGTQPTNTPASSSSAQKSEETNWFSVIAIIGAFFMPIVGIIFGILGMNQAKQTGKGRGLALAGLILSIGSILLSVIIPVVVFILPLLLGGLAY